MLERARMGRARVLPLLCCLLSSQPAASLDAGETLYRLRVSVKRVLSPAGEPPRGRYRTIAAIADAFADANAALRRSHAALELVLTEVVDAPGAAAFYVMRAQRLRELEFAAKRAPADFLWRDDAINLYLVDSISDAGGVCSFPTSGPTRDTVAINASGILGGGEGWLHEIGHYLNLPHTHDALLPDTLFDPPPDGSDCADHDRNLLLRAESSGASEYDLLYTLHNVMSYHCDPLVLTPLQVTRMRRALLDHRAYVLEPSPAAVAPLRRLPCRRTPA
jgi:hypothetical protein